MKQPWVDRVHGGAEHCAHGISYREICGKCWGLTTSTKLDVALYWASVYREKRSGGESLSGHEQSVLALAEEVHRLTARVGELEANEIQDRKDMIRVNMERDRLRAAAEEVLKQFAAASTGQAHALRILREALAGTPSPPEAGAATVSDKVWTVLAPRVYDPRKDSTNGGDGPQRRDDPSTWTGSTNTALLLRDYLQRFNLGGPNDALIAEMANICDEKVPVHEQSQSSGPQIR